MREEREREKSEMISWALPFMLKPKCEATRTTALKRMWRGVSPRWNKINHYLHPLRRISQRTRRGLSLSLSLFVKMLEYLGSLSRCSSAPPLARPIFTLFNHISFIAFIFLWFKIVFDGMALVALAVVNSDVDSEWFPNSIDAEECFENICSKKLRCVDGVCRATHTRVVRKPQMIKIRHSLCYTCECLSVAAALPTTDKLFSRFT